MDTKYFDVIVAKEYESKKSGKVEKRTAWNKVGRAWTAKSGESINIELYVFPNQRYVVKFQDRDQQVVSETKLEDIPF